jgi:hypothetical protein
MVAPPVPPERPAAFRPDWRVRIAALATRPAMRFVRWRAQREIEAQEKPRRHQQVIRGFIQINLIQRPH